MAIKTTGRLTLLLLVGSILFVGLMMLSRYVLPHRMVALLAGPRDLTQTDIYLLDVDHAAIVGLTHQPAHYSIPIWSPDGSELVFTRFSDDKGGNLIVMDADGTNARSVFRNGYMTIEDPAWSPNGRQFVFNFFHDIMVVNADGSGTSRVIKGDSFRPSWSPDSTKVAYVSTYTQYGITLVNLEDDNQLDLYHDTCLASTPAWSPDGNWIAVARICSRGGTLHVMTTASQNRSPRTVIELDTPPQGAPLWSPDGRQIAFVEGAPGGVWTVNLIDADGSNQRELGPISPYTLPIWTPDSRQIICVRPDGIYALSADGSSSAFLVNPPGHTFGLSWRP